MKKKMRIATFILIDIIFINMAFLLALLLHSEGKIDLDILTKYNQLVLLLVPIKLLVYKYFYLYDSLWEYASIEELVKVVSAVVAANTISVTYMVIMGLHVFSGIYINAVLFEIVLIGGSRFSYRVLRRVKQKRTPFRYNGKNVLIVGTGSTAAMIATEIKNHADTYGQVIGYIDDDDNKRNKTIAGTKILGNRHEIYGISKRYHIDEIVLAIPTLSKEDVREILEECKRTKVKVRIVPGIMEIIDGKVSINEIRDVEIEDLLGRDPVDLNVHEIASYIEDKTILVTGGGGSIGSELCRHITRFNPKKLIVLDIYENNAYEIQNELLRTHGNNLNLEVIIASVRDRETIFEIIKTRKPDVIFHAAAHKHVPLMEHAPKEAIKNNVFGTMNLAEAADEFGVGRFVLISTDKAVNPTNVMGASKRTCEMIIQGLAKNSKTKFVAVRFGNVLGSNGSVIPLFKKQIAEGGPITITHKGIIRYFMTIPEAAQLVIQAGAIANGGEIFVLDMGDPVKIYDLAIDLVKLSGLEPHEDIKFEFTGLRPGEKLYEELLMAEEGLENTKYKKIFIGHPGDITYPLLKKSFQQLKEGLITMDNDEFKDLIMHIVPTYMKDQRKEELKKDSGGQEEVPSALQLLKKMKQ